MTCRRSCSPSSGCSCSQRSAPPASTGTSDSLAAKLAAVDYHSEKTRAFIHAFIDDRWDELVILAKGRLVTGHFVWGDKNFKEWDEARLLKEFVEEQADGINYITERWEKLG